ncbi:MAG TPA: hypothetical protein VF469_33380 [Kofleriaceae bacterium]
MKANGIGVIDAAGLSVGRREVDSVLDDVRGVHEEFLQRFMEAERRAIDLADKLAGRDRSRAEQLDELRVLVVDEVDDFMTAMTDAVPRGFAFVHATSGGEGLLARRAAHHSIELRGEMQDMIGYTPEFLVGRALAALDGSHSGRSSRLELWCLTLDERLSVVEADWIIDATGFDPLWFVKRMTYIYVPSLDMRKVLRSIYLDQEIDEALAALAGFRGRERA